MEKSAMFGDIEKFMDSEYFSTHQYGNLYHDEKNYGLEVFCAFEANAYELDLFKPIETEEKKKAFLERVDELSKNKRDIGITTDDKIIMFYTCSDTLTNGRYCVCAKITSETYINSFSDDTNVKVVKNKDAIEINQSYVWIYLIVIAVILEFVLILIKIVYKKKGKNEKK